MVPPRPPLSRKYFRFHRFSPRAAVRLALRWAARGRTLPPNMPCAGRAFLSPCAESSATPAGYWRSALSRIARYPLSRPIHRLNPA
jgi:hypothetical protein